MKPPKLILSLAGVLALSTTGCASEPSDEAREEPCSEDDSACMDQTGIDPSALLWWPRRDGGRWPRPRRDAALPDARVSDAEILDAEPVSSDGGSDAGPGEEYPFTKECEQPGAVGRTRRAGNRVLSAGSERWILLDLETRREVASGPVGPFAAADGRNLFDLSASHAVIPISSTTLELRRAQDGQVVATLSADASMARGGLSIDGSYAWAHASSLMIWSLTGQVLAQHSDGSRPGWVFAAAGELRAIHQNGSYPSTGDERPLAFWREVVRIDGSAQLQGTYGGTFRSWFDEGDRFITVEQRSPTVHYVTPFPPEAYGSTVVTEPGFRVLGGFRSSIWGTTSDNQHLNVHALPAASGVQPLPPPVLSLDGPVATGAVRSERGSLALFGADASTFSLVDLRGETPVVSEVQLPGAALPASFASDSRGDWALATSDTLYASGPEGFFALGCRAP